MFYSPSNRSLKLLIIARNLEYLLIVELLIIFSLIKKPFIQWLGYIQLSENN